MWIKEQCYSKSNWILTIRGYKIKVGIKYLYRNLTLIITIIKNNSLQFIQIYVIYALPLGTSSISIYSNTSPDKE